jgi:Ca2+/Na+ antiporter
MEEIIKFFNYKISNMVIVFFIIYIILYILKVDILLISTLIIFIIYFFYEYQKNKSNKEIILTSKNEKFKNEIPLILRKYEDIINFLFYISDFKQYNYQVYNELIININDFLTLYEDYQIVRKEQKKLMKDVLFDTKHKILDGLSSFIFSFNNSPDLREKLNNSIEKLNIILNSYINKLNIQIDNVEAFNDN